MTAHPTHVIAEETVCERCLALVREAAIAAPCPYAGSRLRFSPATIHDMAKKRGYSREFTPQTERRIKREIDRVPATLDAKVQAKCKRDGISLRALTLTLWRMWVGRGDRD